MYGKRKYNMEKTKFNLKRSIKEARCTYINKRLQNNESCNNSQQQLNQQPYPACQPIQQVQTQQVNQQNQTLHQLNNNRTVIKKSTTPTIIKPLNINIMKRCLLIGINYTGTNNELNGCINDCENLRNFLINSRYFASNEVVMMTDFTPGVLYPSKKNIMLQLDALVKFARKYPTKQVVLFVAYSGHGHYIKDLNGDEGDRKDEVLCPIDFERDGFIIDDELRSKFVNLLPSNVKLVMLVDACHSGTILDLKYSYKADEKNTYSVIGKLNPTTSNIVMISGCKDNQTSSDAYINDPSENKLEYQGAMTAAFLANYRENISYNELISNMRIWLKDNNYSQTPQLSSGKLIDIDTRFIMETYK
ncbi:caspase-like protein [Fadolivirus algeromassiliense]|jgi:hypothetical protein|uniref:Caspase-like protein n=1 Tax=Fadolivirus FV1/VV64 TaxID=3070911 RepID=A0A7D3R1E6_9VIRU|nr:caspase-like protein [Fadolivirus algeromassiliense]QKF94321.1 caspase-like protein [Fadolivirus FV1/VV64]